MANITIITPTYNRADMLRKCYKSLLNQNCQDFEWFIVDDGSTDETNLLVEQLIKEGKINIRYLNKNNGGKHTAVNLGIKQIDTELTLILDSDDYLTDDAVEQILFYHNKFGSNKKLCGFSFLKIFSDGNINGKYFPKDELVGSFIQVRINGGIPGDKCEVFYTRCLKEFPFPEFKGEKFIGESVSWIPMGMKYDMVHINKGIYVGDYLHGGLTKQGRKMRILCPKGGMAYAKVSMTKQCNFKRRLTSGILYSCYSFFANVNLFNIIKNNKYKVITIITLPIGYGFFKYWNFKYK